ncbi:MAG TPA: cache domain-containing protein, partial [Rhodocyclaceae bacterium]|nr:cache domain-containing protein [Rhodocyclaceae bacterium]
MSPFRSRLLWKAFLSVVLGLALWFPLFYWLTVPLINRLAYEVEEKAARNVLNNVAEMVGQSHHDLLAWRQSALDAHRRELKNIVLVIDSWAKELEGEVAAGRRTRPQARQELLGRLRQVRYGNNDYLWAADYRSLFLSHPDAAFDRRDASALRDSQGRLVLPPMVEQARKSGEGYFSYWWKRLDTGHESEKLSYVRDFPAWGFVVGTGVYIDDVDQEVARRRQAMTTDLRQHLRKMETAGSGHVFIVDGRGDTVVHPDGLPGDAQGARPNGGDGLGARLVAAAQRPDKTLF